MKKNTKTKIQAFSLITGVLIGAFGASAIFLSSSGNLGQGSIKISEEEKLKLLREKEAASEESTENNEECKLTNCDLYQRITALIQQNHQALEIELENTERSLNNLLEQINLANYNNLPQNEVISENQYNNCLNRENLTQSCLILIEEYQAQNSFNVTSIFSGSPEYIPNSQACDTICNIYSELEKLVNSNQESLIDRTENLKDKIEDADQIMRSINGTDSSTGENGISNVTEAEYQNCIDDPASSEDCAIIIETYQTEQAALEAAEAAAEAESEELAATEAAREAELAAREAAEAEERAVEEAAETTE